MDPPGADLASILGQAGVSISNANLIEGAGWTLDQFAVGFSSLQDFDQEDSLSDLGLEADISRLQRAALKVAWQKCVETTKSSQPPADSVDAPASSTSQLLEVASGSWSESFAPKLTGSVVTALKQKFCKSYPSEVLTQESMPGQRLLSLIHYNLSKKHWKWVPWKYRMNLAKEEDLQTGRSSKIPRLEHLQLHNTIMDEPPSLDISNAGMGLHALRISFDVFNTAVALCEGAHLASLKTYSMKFMSFLTIRYGIRLTQPDNHRSSVSRQDDPPHDC